MGRPARIDRERVLAEALALADEDGLDAVSMSALARRLGVTPMALYRHVASKAALLDGLVERLLAESITPLPDAPWPHRLATFARDLRATARRHPAAFGLLLGRPVTTAASRHARDAITTALIDAGIDPARADQLQRLLSTAVLGFALSETAGRFDALTGAQRDADFELLLAMLTDVVRTRADGGLADRPPRPPRRAHGRPGG